MPPVFRALGSVVHEFVKSHSNDDSGYDYDFDNERAFHEEIIPEVGDFWNIK